MENRAVESNKLNRTKISIDKTVAKVKAAIIDSDEDVKIQGITNLFLKEKPIRLTDNQIEVNKLRLKVTINEKLNI